MQKGRVKPNHFICPNCNTKDGLVLHMESALINFPVDYKRGKLLVDFDTGRASVCFDDDEFSLMCDECAEKFEYEADECYEMIINIYHKGQLIWSDRYEQDSIVQHRFINV